MVRQSPFWLKRCIRSAGMRPINNAVDITNFVMLETGQPLHAFDWNKFPDGRVLVRAAASGETFVTLDNVTRTLPNGAVMITNGATPVAIGGVMGGADSEVTGDTTDFMIESAYFSPQATRRTRTRLGMATESALRFEKGVDPNGVRFALDRAADLFAKLTGGSVLAGAVDAYPAPVEPVRLDLDPEHVNRILGTNLSTPSMIDILGNLEFGVVTGKTASITVPTFRPDVTREIDLVEEIARIHGYDKIPVNRHGAGMLPTPREKRHRAYRKCREILEGLGFTEIVTNSLTDPRKTTVEEKSHVTIRNPLSAELSVLRPDLITGALTVVAHNMNRQADSVAVYEIGRVFERIEGDHSIDEHAELVIALSGQAPTSGWDTASRAYDFFDLKSAALELASAWTSAVSIAPSAVSPFAPSDSFTLLAASKRIGALGLIDPSVADRFDIRTPVWLGRLEIDSLVLVSRDVAQYRTLPRFPAAFRDIAIVVDKSLPVGALEATIRQAGGEMLQDVRLFDRYTGKPIPEGKISVAFSISYSHPDRTLTDDEVESAQRAIVAALESGHGAMLRQ
jgi:phenylalanyl-tRNA synthetase beta chain